MRKIISFFLAAAVSLNAVISSVCAAGSTEMLQSLVSENEASLFMKVSDSSIVPQSVSADGGEAEILSFEPIDENTKINTVFMLDTNAFYGDDKLSENALLMLREFLSGAAENEDFSLIGFDSKGADEIVPFTKNPMLILEGAEKTEFTGGTADLEKAIRFVLERYDSSAFERLIVFTESDTVNISLIINEDAFSAPFPLSLVIFDREEKAVYAQNYYKYSEGTDISTIPNLINDRSDIFRLSIRIPDEVLGRGGQKRITVELEGNGISERVEETIEFPERQDRYIEKENSEMKILVVVMSFIAFSLAVILVIVLRKNKKVTETVNDEKSHYTVPLAKKKNSFGTIINTVSTRVLFKDSGVFKIILTELGNPENKIEISSEKEAVIGRNRSMSDFVIYNERSVSQRHCKIYSRNSKIYVADLGSLNHTYVDGEEAKEETELFTGSVLKIGRSVFDVKIIPL